MKNYSAITIIETGLRDGLQAVDKYVAIEDKHLHHRFKRHINYKGWN